MYCSVGLQQLQGDGAKVLGVEVCFVSFDDAIYLLWCIYMASLHRDVSKCDIMSRC